METARFKTVIDPLYGIFDLDSLLAQLLAQPEIQRLREVRLSNIPSLFLPGSSNISRFEHSLGTAYLARTVSQQLRLAERETCLLICAAILHDVTITPFGHLMEQGFSFAGRRFDHEKRLAEIFTGSEEIGTHDVQIYRSRTVGFRRVLNRREYKELGVSAQDIFELINGRGHLGKLINGSIDLDNIDNVCRMAYHLGVPYRHDLPRDLISGFLIEDGELGFLQSKCDLIPEWLDLRERLYNALMTNPWDFVAKAMLIEAIRLAIIGTPKHKAVLDTPDWKLTDAELIAILEDYEPSAPLIDRLLLDDPYELLALLWLDGDNVPADFLKHEGAADLRRHLSNIVGCNEDDLLVYWIKDRRTREINNLRVGYQGKLEADPHVFGRKSSLVLFGVAGARRGMGTASLAHAIVAFFDDIAGGSCAICDPLSHMHQAMQIEDAPVQLELF